MNMLRHEDVAEYEKVMTAAQFFQTPFKDDSQFVVVQERPAAIAAEGQEMQMTELLVALEVGWHEESLAATPTHDQVRVMGGAPGFVPTWFVRNVARFAASAARFASSRSAILKTSVPRAATARFRK